MAMDQSRRNQTEMMARQNKALAEQDVKTRKEKRAKKQVKKAELLEQEKAWRQEDRENEPMISWVYRTFRVITIGAVLILGGMEVYNGMATHAENMWTRVFFISWSAWMAFGLVWAGAAVVYWLSLRKNGEGRSRAARNCIVNIIVAVLGMAVLGVLALV